MKSLPTPTRSHQRHGMAGNGRHPLYAVWLNMKQRCTNPKRKDFKFYGARGVSVCCEWLNDFQAFFNWAIASGWKLGLQIDRINDGDYGPDNCRFVTSLANNRNRRNNVLVDAFGKVKCVSEWANETGIAQANIYKRLRLGWTAERALTTPPRKLKVISERTE